MNRLMTNVVKSIGPDDADMFFIGEAPGADEDRLCEPFRGMAGQLLDRCFKDKGIVRPLVRIGNIFLQRPPRNNVLYFYRDKQKKSLTDEGQEHLDQLESLLLKLQRSGSPPKVLVALGATAMRHLTGKKRINKWRGTVLPCTLVKGYKVYPTYHPSWINRMMQEQAEKRLEGEKKKWALNGLPLFLLDLERIQTQSEFPDIRYPERDFIVCRAFGEAMSYLQGYLDRRSPVLVCDIETIPGPAGTILWMIGFAENSKVGISIPFLWGLKFCWSLEEEAKILQKISEIFLHPEIKICCQGGGYDLSILGKYYGLRVANGTYEDTMWCHHANYPYIRKGLEVLASIYTWEPYYKDEGRVNIRSRTDQGEARYNAKDCCVQREIWPIVRRDGKELNTWDGYRRSMSVFPSLLAMMLRGVKINVEAKQTLGLQFGARAKAAKENIFQSTGVSNWNPNSPDSMRKLLYGYLGLPLQFNHKTKKVTTDKDALQKLRRKFPKVPEIEWLLDHRKFGKLESTYTDMEVAKDGRIYTSYGFVSTWRLNSSESAFGVGGNLQNIPVKGDEGKLVRSLFVADEGMEMLAMDYEKAEAQVVAYEAEDLERIEMFEAGWDIHWYNACKIFRIPETVKYIKGAKYRDYITREEHTLYQYRQIGKTVVHAGNYGMGPRMLQAILAREGFVLPYTTCKQLLSSHIANNIPLQNWQRSIREELKATRVLITALGRKRYFPGRFNTNLWNAGYAFRPQSTVGEMMEMTIQRAWEEIPTFYPLLNVHDEIVGEGLRPDREKHIKMLTECSKIPLEIHGRTLTIGVDFKAGPDWGHLEEL